MTVNKKSNNLSKQKEIEVPEILSAEQDIIDLSLAQQLCQPMIDLGQLQSPDLSLSPLISNNLEVQDPLSFVSMSQTQLFGFDESVDANFNKLRKHNAADKLQQIKNQHPSFRQSLNPTFGVAIIDANNSIVSSKQIQVNDAGKQQNEVALKEMETELKDGQIGPQGASIKEEDIMYVPSISSMSEIECSETKADLKEGVLVLDSRNDA